MKIQKFIFGLAVVCALALAAGCKTTATKKNIERTPVPAPTPPSAPLQTNLPPSQVSHPKPPAEAADNMAPNILAWDSVAKKYHAKIGETNAPFTFSVTNVSPERVMIYDTSTTCDCTVAQLPSKPWTLAPGAGGQIHASLDLRNRIGAVTNYVIVFTSKGNRLLTVTATLPAR
jgi:hypothetical protein